MAENDSSRTGHAEEEFEFELPRASEGLADVRDPLPAEVRDPSFHVAVRGYDRHAVDRYVEYVNRLIAELQVGGSPRAAVRHALDRVGEQTSGILQRARDTAEEITHSAREEAEETIGRARAEAGDILEKARSEAEETTARAQAEADHIVAGAQATADEMLTRAKSESESTIASARVEAEGRVRRAEDEITTLRDQAEARMHALQADTHAVEEQRSVLLAQVREVAGRLTEIAGKEEPAEEEPAEEKRAEEESPPTPDSAEVS